MEKLVYRRSGGDGYTYSFEDWIPFVYESKEKFIDDMFEYAYKMLTVFVENPDGWKNLNDWLKQNVFFKNQEFEIHDFWFYNKPTHDKKGRNIVDIKIENYTYNDPMVLTVDEWFEREEDQVLWKN